MNRILSILFFLLSVSGMVFAQESTLEVPANLHLGLLKFGFIGDSQIAVTQGAMPKTFAEDLGVDVEFYGQSSAHARHYLGTVADLKHKGSTNVESLSLLKCRDAYQYFTQTKKPDYIIIALGHNSTADLQTLIDGFRSEGIRTILVRMFPIPKISDLRSRYNGISADINLDLLDFSVTTMDQIHPNKDEMIRVGHEVARQLLDYFIANGVGALNGSIPPAPGTEITYVKARDGETLRTISERKGVSLDLLHRLNPHMQIGDDQELRYAEKVRIN